MEFWGVEVKAGESLKVVPEARRMIHISQAAVGELKKDANDSIPLFVKVEEQKLVLGTLSKAIPQIAFDLVFEDKFELSHNWKNGSVYFCGYEANIPDEESSEDDSSSDEEELNLPLENAADVKPEIKEEKVKPNVTTKNAAKKPQVKAEEPKDDDDSDDDSDSDSDDSDMPDDVSGLPVDSDLEGSDNIDDSDDSGDDDDSVDDDMSDDEETPKKAESGKKRAADSSATVPAKKVKLATPAKTDAKKGSAHKTTPHPAKQVAKTDKSKAASPKSAGSVTCNTCSKTFNSDGALQSHAKAKHASK